MAHTRAWSVTKADPADTDYASGLGDDIRTQAVDIEERMVIDHDWDSITTGGEHTQVTMQERVGDPGGSADYIKIYVKDDGGKPELFIEDEDANVIQLTKSGEIKSSIIAKWATAILMENSIALQGEDAAAAAQDLIQIDGSDEILIGDSGVGTIEKVVLKVASDAPAGASTPEDLLVYDYGGGEQKVWHEGNDGTASGLDADTVDTYEGTDLLLSKDATEGARFYKSGDQSSANSAGAAIAHNLGGAPRLVMGELRCKAADAGYVNGDVIPVGINTYNTGGGAMGVNIWFSATEVGYRVGALGFNVQHKTTGTITTRNAADWKVGISAWR